MGNLSIGNFRMPEDCPKCASNVTFERTYVPRGTCKVFPGGRASHSGNQQGRRYRAVPDEDVPSLHVHLHYTP